MIQIDPHSGDVVRPVRPHTNANAAQLLVKLMADYALNYRNHRDNTIICHWPIRFSVKCSLLNSWKLSHNLIYNPFDVESKPIEFISTPHFFFLFIQHNSFDHKSIWLNSFTFYQVRNSDTFYIHLSAHSFCCCVWNFAITIRCITFHFIKSNHFSIEFYSFKK